MNNDQDERGNPVGSTHDPVRKEFSVRNSRQGGRGVPVLKVLVASLVLVVIVWGGVEMWGNHIDPTTPKSDEQNSATSTEEPVQDTIDNSVPGATQTVPTDRDPTPQTGTGGESQTVTPDGTSN